MSLIKIKQADGFQVSPKSSSYVLGQLKTPSTLKIPNLFAQSDRSVKHLGKRQGSELRVKQASSNKVSTLDAEPKTGYFKFLEKYLTQTERLQLSCPKVRNPMKMSPQSKIVLSCNNVKRASLFDERFEEETLEKSKNQYASTESQCIEEFFPLNPVSSSKQPTEKKQKYFQHQLKYSQGEPSRQDFNQMYQSLIEQHQRQLQQEITLISKSKTKLTPLSKVLTNTRQKFKYLSTPRVLRYISFD